MITVFFRHLWLKFNRNEQVYIITTFLMVKEDMPSADWRQESVRPPERNTWSGASANRTPRRGEPQARAQHRHGERANGNSSPYHLELMLSRFVTFVGPPWSTKSLSTSILPEQALVKAFEHILVYACTRVNTKSAVLHKVLLVFWRRMKIVIKTRLFWIQTSFKN